MFKEIWVNRRVIFRLSIFDFKSFFKASALTYFWVFLSPALMIGVYLFSFVSSGDSIDKIELPSYNPGDALFFTSPISTVEVSRIAWLIIGVLTWSYVGSIISYGSTSIRTYSWLVTKIGSPLSTPPILVNLSKSYLGVSTILVSWVIYMIIAGANGNSSDMPVASVQFLQLPLMIFLLFCFLSLWSLATAPLCAISRDIYNFILILPMFFQWITGVFLPLSPSNMTSPIGIIFRINPFNFLISNIRGSIMSNTYFWSDMIALISFIAFFMILFLFALFILKRSKKIVVDLV